MVLQELNSDKHQFAFFYQDLIEQPPNSWSIVDKDLVHRISRVVKISIGQYFALFNQDYHCVVQLIKAEKKQLSVCLVSSHKNIALQPRVVFLLPLLKREALESAVYSLAELGINEIQLVITDKSRQKCTDKDLLRLEKVVIAAAEQSKHFAFPKIYAPRDLEDCVKQIPLTARKSVFDISGTKISIDHVRFNNIVTYVVVGPEGGLLKKELSFLLQHDFISYSLTQTVLRAVQAVAIGAAIFRL